MADEPRLAIVMADVSSEGVPAALFMVIGKTLIKDHTQPERQDKFDSPVTTFPMSQKVYN